MAKILTYVQFTKLNHDQKNTYYKEIQDKLGATKSVPTNAECTLQKATPLSDLVDLLNESVKVLDYETSTKLSTIVSI